jgi:hypothetical protein
MRAGLLPLSFPCRMPQTKKNDLKNRLARYRQFKLNVISGNKLCNP